MCRLTLFIKVLKECKSWKLWKLSFYNNLRVETTEDKNAFNTMLAQCLKKLRDILKENCISLRLITQLLLILPSFKRNILFFIT